MTNHPTIDWLLEPSDPSMRYRTLRQILDRPEDDPEVRAVRQAIPASPAAVVLLEKMHPEGYWLQRNQNSGKVVGDGTEYGSFGTTHFILAYLAELGLDRTHPQVALAAERYLNLQQPDGDWRGHYSCLFGYNIRNFLRLGYRGDERLERSVDLLHRSIRWDNGYLCDFHEPPPTRKRPKSCVRGALKALSAYSELGPAYWEHPSCLKLLDYFLCREGIFQRGHPDTLVNKDMGVTMFPIHWRATITELLYHLSRMGHGNDPRLERAWALLETKVDHEGRYRLDRVLTNSPWKVGPVEAANKWVTFYAFLAKKEAGRLNLE